MKRLMLIAVVCAFMALAPMSARAAMYTMHTATTTIGNQGVSSVGLQFTVNAGPGIRVLGLGIYDSAQDGILGGATLSTVIFDSTPTSLKQIDFTADSSGTLDGAYLFKDITPLTLLPGTYTIAGYGFNVRNNEFNSNKVGLTGGPTFDDGGGLISFVDSVWGAGADVAPTYPITLGATSGFGVHDFFDGPNMNYEVVPVPGAVLLGILGLSVAGIKLRKHA